MNNKVKLVLIAIIAMIFIMGLSACEMVSISLTLDANGGVFEGGGSTHNIKTDGTSTVTIPKNPTKDGYTFDGWFWDKDEWEEPFTANSLIESPIKSDTTVYAKWVEGESATQDPTTYTITFDSQGGSDIADIVIEAGATITIPANPTKTGYTFDGWYLDEDYETSADDIIGQDISSSITLYAKWIEEVVIIRYPVTLDYEIDEIVYNVIENTTLLRPPYSILPEREGYIFDDWYADEEYTTLFDFDTLITQAITIYGKWITAYVVSFESNGGSDIESITQIHGATLIEPSAPTRAGYEFAGWYLDIDLTDYYIFTTMPAESFTLYADWGTEGLAYKSINEDTEYSVSQGIPANLHITIPNRYQGKLVTTISDNAFISFPGISIESITIPSSIANIEANAFVSSNFMELIVDSSNSVYKSIDGVLFNKTGTILIKYPRGNTRTSYTIPSSVTTIGNSAFTYANLTSITIPNSVITIDNYAFASCRNLTSISFEGNSQLTSIGIQAFSDCSSLTSIFIPSNLTIITDFAFFGCSSLTSIIIPDGITSIGNNAFAYCSSLISITIPDGITSTGEHAFYNCAKLETVNIERPSSLGLIAGANFMFANCAANFKIFVPDLDSEAAYKSNHFWGFYSSKIYSKTRIDENGLMIENNELLKYLGNGGLVTIPSNVTSIGNSAFKDYTNLTGVIVPNTVTSIGNSAFASCSNLSSIIFEENSQLLSIGQYTFKDCTSLASISIPESVVSIGIEAFTNTAIYNNTANNSLIYADKWIVGYNGNIGSVSLLTDTVGIGDGAFFECDLTSIVIPDSVISIGGGAFYQCYNLSSITIGSGVISIGDWAFQDCFGLVNIIIPSNVISIGNNAFYNCSNLTSITISEGVTHIGDGAFWDCSSLSSIIIPSSVTSLGNSVFRDCINLTSVTFEENSQLITIGTQAFQNCSSLEIIIIPDNVEIIGSSAFYGCSNLTSVIVEREIPPSLGSNAFLYTPSSLKIYVPSESVDAYKTAEGWSEYADRIYPIED